MIKYIATYFLNYGPQAQRHLCVMYVALFIIFALVGGAFMTLISYSGDLNFSQQLSNSYIQRVFSFTLMQATLSTLLSILLALPIARFFYFQHFKGKEFILSLSGIFLVLPVIVVTLGIIQIHGRSGYISDLLSYFQFHEQPDYLYGLNGILLAHIFFNTPLAIRGIVSQYRQIPAEQWRLSRNLGFNHWQNFKSIEWPQLKNILPGLASLIMMMCFTSFAIVMTLGGGPKATTLEVAIYQAVNFEFDFDKAVTLSLLQLIVCGSFTYFLNKQKKAAMGSVNDGLVSHQIPASNSQPYTPSLTRSSLALSALAIILFSLIILPPFLSIFIDGMMGINQSVVTNPHYLTATFTSLKIAFLAGGLALFFAIAISLGLRYIKTTLLSGAIETLGAIILVISPFALATGLFLALFRHFSIDQLAPYLVILINALMVLPIALRILTPAFRKIFIETDLLCRNLNITGFQRLKKIEFPLLRRPIALASAYCVTFSLGDFGIIALFGGQNFKTLPLEIYSAMGAYRMSEAAALSMILVGLCFALFFALEKFLSGKKTQHITKK